MVPHFAQYATGGNIDRLLASVVARIGRLVLLIGTRRQFTVKNDGKRQGAPDIPLSEGWRHPDRSGARDAPNLQV